MVDKYIGAELAHAVGLIAFGKRISPINEITREYESFHDQLGRLDAGEPATALYDAIQEATQFMQEFAKQNADQIMDNCIYRIFALTMEKTIKALDPPGLSHNICSNKILSSMCFPWVDPIPYSSRWQLQQVVYQYV